MSHLELTKCGVHLGLEMKMHLDDNTQNTISRV